MKLIETKTGRELKPGDTVTTFRGETAVLKSIEAPKREGSTGRVHLDGGSSFYPSVIGAAWVLDCGCANHDGGPYAPGCADMAAPATAPGLPDVCWTIIHGAAPGNRIGCIKRGETGYYRSDYDRADMTAEQAQALVDHMNEKLGLTHAQVTAMEIGSMRGWDVPGADPARVQKGMDEAAARREDDKRRRA